MSEVDNLWKFKDGSKLPIDKIDSDRLEEVIQVAESLYVHHEHKVLALANIAALYEDKLTLLYKEAAKRGVNFKSLSEIRDSKKYNMLKHMREVLDLEKESKDKDLKKETVE